MRRYIVFVIRIKLVQHRSQSKTGKAVKELPHYNKGTGKAILLRGKDAVFGEQVRVKCAKGEADINQQRRNNGLPANGAHAVKIIQNRERGERKLLKGKTKVFKEVKSETINVKQIAIVS